MAHKRQTALELAQRREKVARMYLEGKSQMEIASVVEVTQGTISNDLKALRKQWTESALIDINEIKARELAKIDRLEATYWEAWFRSVGVTKIETVKARKGRGDDGETTAEKTIRTEDLNGDPRYLDGVGKCIERRCKLLGIDNEVGGDLRPLHVKMLKWADEPDADRE